MGGAMRRQKIGLVLSSGGERGLTYIGVIKVLEKYKIPIDIITGSSAGALIGGVYASGVPIEEIKKIAMKTRTRDLMNLIDFIKPGPGLIDGGKISRFISKILAKKNIEDFKIPFACVAADLLTGKKVVFKKGDAVTAIRASISFPGIFKPVEYKNSFLVDGGAADPLPIDVAVDMGADMIIAVDVTGHKVNIKKKKPKDIGKPTIRDAIFGTITIFSRQIIEYTLEKAIDKHVVLIRPNTEKIGWKSLVKPADAIKEGEIATEKEIENILKWIPKHEEEQKHPSGANLT